MSHLGRREWIASALALSGGGALLRVLAACSDKEVTLAPATPGRITGRIVDVSGAPQPSLGEIYLMYPGGQQTGRHVSVDDTGHFDFEGVLAGDWQLRFHAPGIAFVPEEFPHPVRLSVQAGQTTDVSITIEFGWEDGAPMIEVYIGDYFFQEQPLGRENTETVVKIGTPVCWYNVGRTDHTATGGPWDSGVIQRTGSYIWIPDRIGVFPYYCAFHRTAMIASLRVQA